MKKLGKKLVDFKKELDEMTSYIMKTWTGEESSIKEIVSMGFYDGYEIANNGASISDNMEFIVNWIEERRSFLDAKYNSDAYSYFDGIFNIPKNILFNSLNHNEKNLKNFNFENKTKNLFKSIPKSLVDKNLLPNDWDLVKKSGLSAYDYFDSFTLDSEKLFNGHDSQCAVAGGFEHRTNLAFIYYEKTEQGQNPQWALYAAAFSHGMKIKEHNNTINLFIELKKIKEEYSNEKYDYITYVDFSKLSENKVVKALTANYSKSEFKSQEELNLFINELNNKSKSKNKP